MPEWSTKEELENYRDSGLCPYCEGADMTDSGRLWEEGVLKIVKFCTGCNKSWTEVYTLTGIILKD